MLHFIHFALPFLVFAMYSLEPFFKTNPILKIVPCHIQFQESCDLVCIFEIWLSFIQPDVPKVNNLVLFCLYSLSLSLSVSLFLPIIYFCCLIPSTHTLTSLHAILICLVLSLFLPTRAPFCSPFHQHFLGSSAAATGTWETTCSPEGAAGPAEVSAGPDSVFTEPTPATAGRTEETENNSPEHAGEGCEEFREMAYMIYSSIDVVFLVRRHKEWKMWRKHASRIAH